MYIGNGMIVNAENPVGRRPGHRPLLDAVRRRGPPWLTRRTEHLERPAAPVGGWPASRCSWSLVVGHRRLADPAPTRRTTRRSRRPPAAAGPPRPTRRALLRDLEAAVRRHDAGRGAPPGARRPGRPRDPRRRGPQRPAAPRDRTSRCATSTRSGGVAADGTWAADVARRPGGSPASTPRRSDAEVRVRLRALGGGRLAIAGDRRRRDRRTPAVAHRPGPGPPTPRRPGAGRRPAAQADRLAGGCAERAVPQVRRVLPDVARPPGRRGARARSEALDAGAGRRARAVRRRSPRSPPPSTAPAPRDAPVHVFVNPRRLRPAAARGAPRS